MLSNNATRRGHYDGGAQEKRRAKDEEEGRVQRLGPIRILTVRLATVPPASWTARLARKVNVPVTCRQGSCTCRAVPDWLSESLEAQA